MPALVSFRPAHTRGQCRSCHDSIRVDVRGWWVHDLSGQPACCSLTATSPTAAPALPSVAEPAGR